MKKRFISIIIVLTLLLAIPPGTSQASQMPCFTGVNDTLLPLRDATMPAYFGTKLYVPASVFTEFGISSGTSSSQDSLIVYKSSDNIRLYFYISLGMVLDNTGATYENAAVEIIGGLYFLPLDFMCEFFDLSYAVLQNDPMSVLRIKNSSAVYNDKTYIGTYKKQIETAYKEYSSPVTPSAPVVSPVAPTESPEINDFSNITIYLSFYETDKQYTPAILDTLADYGVTACFFLSEAEIASNPALVRRISGEKHMLGIRLDSAVYEEYKNASELLFEAAKIVTPLITSNATLADEVKAMCGKYGLLYRDSTIEPADDINSTAVTGLLSITPYTSDDLRLACTQNTSRILSIVIRYMEISKYSISTITETSGGV